MARTNLPIMIGMCLRLSPELMLMTKKRKLQIVSAALLQRLISNSLSYHLLIKKELPDLFSILFFVPLMRPILEGIRGTLWGLLLCSVVNIQRMRGFDTSICFALSLSMFASLRELNILADNTFFFKLKFLLTCLTSLLFLFRDP